MVREVTFADSKQTFDRCLKFVVDPDTAHSVVRSRENHHRRLVRVVVGNHFVHLEKVTVASCDNVFAETVDSVGEVEVNGVAGTYAEACVATFFSGA